MIEPRHDKQPPSAWDAPLLLTARQVLTDPEEEPVPHGAVLIEQGSVRAVGPAAELAAASDHAVRRDYPHSTIMPGLINAHLHLAFDVTGPPLTPFEDNDDAALDRIIAANAKAALDGGVTTARDLGDRDGQVAAFARRVGAGAAIGPRILSATAPLTPPGGHCWFLGGEVDPQPWDSQESDTRLRRAVEQRAEAGADVIKLMASGGNMTPTSPPIWKSQFTLHQLQVMTEAAHELGLPVAGHAHGTEAMAWCAQAGIDTIEHGSWRAVPGAGQEAGFDCREDVAELIAASGSVVVPTRARDWHSWPPEQLEEYLGRLRWSRDHGIQMIAGNDAGVGLGRFDDLVDLITLFHAAGWSRQAALSTATTRAAAALGHSQDLGRLQPEASADLLVINGDPLTDLTALRAVELTFVAGRPHLPVRAEAR